MPDLVSFGQVAGVPTHYARPPHATYGTRGVKRTFSAAPEFVDKLNQCLADLWVICPFGAAEVLTTAGAFVNKPGMHGAGRAFDIDGIFWPGRDFVSRNFHDDPPFYLGVEAVLHRHFGTVLGYQYDVAHRDHFHVDDGKPVALRQNTRSHALFVQTTCRYVFGITVGIDGVWSDETDDGLALVLDLVGLGQDISTPAAWRAFLRKCAERAFEGVEAAEPIAPTVGPFAALRTLYDSLTRARR